MKEEKTNTKEGTENYKEEKNTKGRSRTVIIT
jgi:hypothetical protein